MTKLKRSASLLSLLSFFIFAETASAQGGMMWGSGMYPAMAQCPYPTAMSEEIMGLKADEADVRERLSEIKSELRRAKSRLKRAERELDKVKSDFQRRGIQGGAFGIIDRHISGSLSCDSYQKESCGGSRPLPPARPRDDRDAPRGTSQLDKLDVIESLLAMSGFSASEPLRNVANVGAAPAGLDEDSGSGETAADRPARKNVSYYGSDCDDSGTSPDPYRPEVWAQACQGSTLQGSFLCRQDIDRGPNFNDRACSQLLKDWYKKKAELNEATNEVAQLETELENLKAEKRDLADEIKEARRESREEYRRSLSEGGCPECMMQSNATIRQSRPNWLEVAGNVGLGLMSMYFGNQQQRYISDNNAKLGFPTQSYPAWGFGFPYFANALYGAVGGGTTSGGFGCGTGFGNGGGGGAFGYPPGMMGGPMGGGLYNGGFGPGGAMMGGPGFMMPGAGMMMGGPMGMMAAGGYMMGAPMPGMMMGGPMGMMAAGGYMMGAPMPGMMMGGPMGMMAAGGYMSPYGMMMGGPMAGSMIAGGAVMPGYMMPGYMMGAPMPGMMMPGMGYLAAGGAFGPGMMMGGPMGMMAGGGYMMGAPMPGMMMGGPMGMMASGGFAMPGYMANGLGMVPGSMMGMPMTGMGMMPGYMGAGMVPGSMMSMMPGGIDPSMMQIQQMQMQLQMQQYQTMMQMQQRRMENYMAQSRVVAGLSMELSTLYQRLQQAQMSMATGGSLGFEFGGYGAMGLTTPGYAPGYISTPLMQGTGFGPGAAPAPNLVR